MNRRDSPEMSENKEHFFTGGYARRLISGAGHFSRAKKPHAVVSAILERTRSAS